MKVRVEVVSLNTDGEEQRRQVLTIERRELAMETLGMNLTEGKALLAGVQDFVVAQQAREELEQRRAWANRSRRPSVVVLVVLTHTSGSRDANGTSWSTPLGYRLPIVSSRLIHPIGGRALCCLAD